MRARPRRYMGQFRPGRHVNSLEARVAIMVLSVLMFSVGIVLVHNNWAIVYKW